MAKSVVQQINSEMEELQKQLTQFKTSVEYLNNAKSSVGKAVDTVNNTNEHFNKRIEELKGTYQSFIRLSDSISSVILKIDSVNFPERLDSIEKTVRNTIFSLEKIKEATIFEVQEAAIAIRQADFEGKFSKLQVGLNKSAKSNQDMSDSVFDLKIPKRIDESQVNITKFIQDKNNIVISNIKEIDQRLRTLIINLSIPQKLDKLDSSIADIFGNINTLQDRLTFIDVKIQTLKEHQEKMLKNIEIYKCENKKWQDKMQLMILVTNVIIIAAFIILFFSKK